MSDDLEKEYRDSKDAAHPVQRCACCKQLGAKKGMHPHHPKGRHGRNLLRYIWVHVPCHRWIHANPRLATARGLLEPGRHTDDTERKN